MTQASVVSPVTSVLDLADAGPDDGRVLTSFANPSAGRWTCPPVLPHALQFHRSMAGYEVTPLVALPELADELGVGRVFVKDESSRFGLPAFKVLGASWAYHNVLARHAGARLVAATDGNHGRAVARTAARLGVGCTVFVPAVMLGTTARLIAGEGADVVRVDGEYDATVQHAARFAADDPQRALVQDTAWPGYEDVPAWIVEGYDTMFAELDEQLGSAPDLIAVPVGVGSLAEAAVRHYRGPGGPRPRVLSVEPDTAACVLASLSRGAPTTVTTGATVMAGLNCGTVSASAWPVLRDGCDAAVAVTDDAARQAMTDLAALGVRSGACGAATLAGVRAALERPDRRAALDLAGDAVVVLLSTEGIA